jgi:hypothetical protein
MPLFHFNVWVKLMTQGQSQTLIVWPDKVFESQALSSTIITIIHIFKSIWLKLTLQIF